MRTIFIGDIHGCASELDSLIRMIRFQKGTDKLYLTGDLFSKGPNPLEVWKIVGSTGANVVKGNHDEDLLALLQARQQGADESDLDASHIHTLDQLKPVDEGILLWLEFLPLSIREPDFTLVHAGINPEKGFARTSPEEFMAIRTWPPTEGIEGPRWHDHYTSPDNRTLIFGHDAPGGLVVKRADDAHPPYAVGLDTGCVYGGKLTGWILEDDVFFEVDARETYA